MSEDTESTRRSYVIDCHVLIDHVRGYRYARDFVDNLLLDGGRVCFSVVSEAEIYSNVHHYPMRGVDVVVLYELPQRRPSR